MPSAIENRPVPSISPLAGRPAPREMLVDVARLERRYFEVRPDLSDPNQMVSFGTSGHRGSPLRGTFTEAHILAISAARPSGTENIYKIYAESFRDQSHLDAIVGEAEGIVKDALNSPNPRRGLTVGRR